MRKLNAPAQVCAHAAWAQRRRCCYHMGSGVRTQIVNDLHTKNSHELIRLRWAASSRHSVALSISSSRHEMQMGLSMHIKCWKHQAYMRWFSGAITQLMITIYACSPRWTWAVLLASLEGLAILLVLGGLRWLNCMSRGVKMLSGCEHAHLIADVASGCTSVL